MNVPAGLAVAIRGQGPAVVLVHGALGDYRQWEPIADSLSDAYRVIAVSRRYHWPNAVDAGNVPYTFEAQAEDLGALLQMLGQPAHLVGHSYGAGVTLLTALSRPERVRSLTLIELPFGSLVSAGTPALAGELASRDALVATIHANVSAGAVEQAAEALIDWVQGGAGGFRQLSPAVQAGLRANAPTMGPTFGNPWTRVTCDQLRALRLPVLVLRGERTRRWYGLIAEAAAACIPGAESAIVPGASHMVIVEDPVATAALIAQFITRY
jgi:pimeloyl-ACP methyl ester carboxylesterase